MIYVKYFLTFFTFTLIPFYWKYYGPKNFLWLSDIGLFLTVASLWLHSSLLMSMAVVGVLAVEVAWNIDFFSKLILNIKLTTLSDYMFDKSHPIALRMLSLFHIFMPIIWILYLAEYGYDTRAPYYVIPLYWLIVLSIYWFTNSKENINWVFLPRIHSLRSISQREWILILCLGFPLLFFLPIHYLCINLFHTL